MRKLARADLIATLLLLVYTIVFSWLTISQHDGFGTHALDLAKFDQAIWNTAQGRPFRISLIRELVIQSHFSPSLALYAPLYWIWSDVRLLFVLQSVFFAGAGFLIYWFFRDDRPWLGLVVYAAYLMHPSLHQVNLVEFRRLTLAVLGTSFVLYHLLRRHYGWMALGLLVILFSKEDMSFTVIGVGLYILVIHRSFKIGLPVLVIGVAFLVLVPFVVLPALNADSSYRHAEKSFAYLGDSPDEMIRSIVTDPGTLLSYVLRGERLSALFRFLWPTLFLFVLAPEIAAFLVPYLAYLLSSTSDALGQLGAWYPSVLLVFLYWAVARGAWRLPKQWQKAGLGLLLISGFSGWLLYSQLWPGAHFQARNFRVTEHDRQVRAVLQRVPTQSSVAAQDALVPHLSHREKIYLFPWVPVEEQLDYVALDRSMGTYPTPLEQYRTLFYDVLAEPEYEIEYQVDDFYLFRRVERLAPDVPRQDTWNDSLTLVGYSVTVALKDGAFERTLAVAASERTARVELFWRVERPMSQNYSVFVHLLDSQGQVWAEHAGWPADAHRPTSVLEPGALIRDVHYLSWTEPLLPDEASLRIGVHKSLTGTPSLLPDGQAFIVVPLLSWTG